MSLGASGLEFREDVSTRNINLGNQLNAFLTQCNIVISRGPSIVKNTVNTTMVDWPNITLDIFLTDSKIGLNT